MRPATLQLAEDRLEADGVEFLQVKTFNPANPDPGDALTTVGSRPRA